MARAAGLVIYRQIESTKPVEYLLLKASYGSKHWSPPKGHVDPGEDDLTTAMRETKEEAGYGPSDLTVYDQHRMELRYPVRGEMKVVVYWLAKLLTTSMVPVLSEEHTDFKWLPAADAIELAGFPQFQRLIEHMEAILADTKNTE